MTFLCYFPFVVNCSLRHCTVSNRFVNKSNAVYIRVCISHQVVFPLIRIIFLMFGDSEAGTQKCWDHLLISLKYVWRYNLIKSVTLAHEFRAL